MIEIERLALKKKVEQERQSFQGVIEKLNQVTLTFPGGPARRTSSSGPCRAADVKDALDKLGFEIDKKKIVLDEPIKRLGNFTVPIKIYHEDKAEVKVVVVKDEAGERRGRRRPERKAEAGGKAGSPRRAPERTEVAMELDLMFLKKTPPHSLEAERTVLGRDPRPQREPERRPVHHLARRLLQGRPPEDPRADHRPRGQGAAGRPPLPDRRGPAGRDRWRTSAGRPTSPPSWTASPRA